LSLRIRKFFERVEFETAYRTMPVICIITVVMRLAAFKMTLVCVMMLLDNMQALSEEYLDEKSQQQEAVYSAIFLQYIDGHKIVVITDVF